MDVSPTSQHILSTQSGPVLEIMLNRPEQGNAANEEMADDIARLIQGATRNSQLVLLRGAGGDFCIGRETMTKPRVRSADPLERRRDYDVIFNCYASLRNSPIPVMAIVQGRAFGFGCALAALCDITIASEHATFQVPEMANNILPTMVMSALIDRVPRKAMNYMIYTG